MLESNPEALERLAQYAAQNDGLHRLYDYVLSEEVPSRISELLENKKDKK